MKEIGRERENSAIVGSGGRDVNEDLKENTYGYTHMCRTCTRNHYIKGSQRFTGSMSSIQFLLLYLMHRAHKYSLGQNLMSGSHQDP